MTAAWVYTLISAAVVTLGYRCGQCAPPPALRLSVLSRTVRLVSASCLCFASKR